MDLVDLAITGHGGRRRWAQISRFRASITITGALRVLAGRPGLFDNVTLEGDTRMRHLTLTPFLRPGEWLTWEPGVADRATGDEGRAAEFVAEENWHHFVAPFVFAAADVQAEETWPWREDAQIWRALLVTFPEPMVAHSRRQTYYLDGAGLVRRLDYDLTCPGGGPAVHYPSRYREFDGIMVPTRRLVYLRDPGGDPDRSALTVDIDVKDVTFR